MLTRGAAPAGEPLRRLRSTPPLSGEAGLRAAYGGWPWGLLRSPLEERFAAGLVPKKMGPAVLSGRQAAVQKQRRSGEAGANGGFPARLTRKRKPRPGLGVAAISPKQPAARRRRWKRAHFGTTRLKPRRPHPSLIPTGPGKPSHVQRPPRAGYLFQSIRHHKSFHKGKTRGGKSIPFPLRVDAPNAGNFTNHRLIPNRNTRWAI